MIKSTILVVSVVTVLSGCAGWNEPIDPGFAGEWVGTSALTIGAKAITTKQSVVAGIVVEVYENEMSMHGICDAGAITTHGSGKEVVWRGALACNIGEDRVPVVLAGVNVALVGGVLHASAHGLTVDHVEGEPQRVVFDFVANQAP